MKVDVDARCDIGCVRSNNEDMVLVADQLLRDATLALRVDAQTHRGQVLAWAEPPPARSPASWR
jgi:hypothetical protein